MSADECTAHTEIAKTLCYHKRYLGDDDLREGYDSILKQGEQGKLNWKDDLADKLHNHLDYRANVIIRDRVALQEGFNKTEVSKQTEKRVNPTDSNVKDKIYYCLEFNLNNCPHSDNHEGRMGSKKVTKFHICRKYHKDGEFKSHREMDECCPRKK